MDIHIFLCQMHYQGASIIFSDIIYSYFYLLLEMRASCREAQKNTVLRKGTHIEDFTVQLEAPLLEFTASLIMGVHVLQELHHGEAPLLWSHTCVSGQVLQSKTMVYMSLALRKQRGHMHMC